MLQTQNNTAELIFKGFTDLEMVLLGVALLLLLALLHLMESNPGVGGGK